MGTKKKGNPKRNKTAAGRTAAVPSDSNKSKRQRWKKGQSCVANPSINKHRATAKRKSNVFSTGGNVLTTKLLSQHNANLRGEDIEVDDDNQSQSVSVISSIASNCTNATFDRVLSRIVTSQSAINVQILALIGSVTEMIDKNNGTQTDTECCATLISLLNSKEPLDHIQKVAVFYLLNLSLKRVSPGVLQVKSKEILDSLTSVTQEDCEDQMLMKSLISCLAHCLRAQNQLAWQSVLIKETYFRILSATVSSKPKIRKAAHHAVAAILRGSRFMTNENAPLFHPAANDTSAFCNKVLENIKGAESITRILHILGLLQDILATFSTTGIKSTCDLILRLLGSADVLLRSVSLKTLHNMFCMSPKVENLTAKLNCQIINALYDFVPTSDPEAMLGWLAVMEKAYCNLTRFKKETLTVRVDPLMNMMLDMMKTTSSKIVFESFGVVGGLYPSTLKKYLPVLDDLYMTEGYMHKEEIKKVMGMAVQKIGPKEVLCALPLKITGSSDTDGDFPRSWLIPVLRDHVQETELAFFVDYFLPLATEINETCKSLSEANNTSRLLAYATLLQQIWALLPSFCNKPTDLVVSFPKIAKIIGKTVEEKSETAVEMLSALRKLINFNLENEAEKAVLARFAKNFIPIFCQVCEKKNESNASGASEGFRMSVLETFKCYLKVSPSQVIVETFEKCLKRLNDTEGKLQNLEKEEEVRKKNSKPKEVEKIQEEKDCVEQWCRLMDLCTAIAPFAPNDRIAKVKENLSRNLQSDNKSVQKKSYKLLEVCPAEFILEHLALLTTFMNDPNQKTTIANPSAQAPRLHCLEHVIEVMDTPQVEFIRLLVPEVVLCAKATSEKARTAAFNLLVKMGDKYIGWFPEQPQHESIQQYFQFFLSGLTVNNQHVVSCTVIALARVLYHFKAQTTDDVIGSLCDITCMLLGHSSREIVQSALSLVHVLMSGYGDALSGKFLPSLVSGLSRLHNIPSFRKKIKDILRKLLRKCGFDVLSGMLPEVYVKVLRNIMKTEKRNKVTKDNELEPKKKKSVDDMLEELDVESDDDEDDEKDEVRHSRKQSRVWIKEDAEILDFTEASAAQKITSSRPQSRTKKDNSEPFKVSKDGRLIIADEEDNKKAKLLDSLDLPKNLKRKFEDSDDDNDSNDDENTSYKAGGTGIHRPINKKSKAEAGQIRSKSKTEPDQRKLKSKMETGQGKPKKAKTDGKYSYNYIKLVPPNKRNVHTTTKRLKEVFKKRKH